MELIGCLPNFPCPENPHSSVVYEKYYEDLVSEAVDNYSIAEVNFDQVPNVKCEKSPPKSPTLLSKLEKAGLLGCFDKTGVNSSNYKKIINNDAEN